jgi:hypothetical protein
VHVDKPLDGEYCPGLQLVHVDIDVAPVAIEYFPATHCKQLEADMLDEYVPGVQVIADIVSKLTYIANIILKMTFFL